MLLDIHEPGQTPLPHAGEKKIAIGIDLGTTHSVVAISRDGKAEILRDKDGAALIASAVHYIRESTMVGKKAKIKASEGDKDAVFSIKRLMGRSMDEAQKIAPHQRIIEKDGLPYVIFSDRPRSAIEVSADILRHLKTIAKDATGQEVTDAVITVPAYFDEAARIATRDAARIAGLNVLRLINEPTAAALAYGLDNAAEGIYAIYDLGGGTFDISILRMEKGVFQVLSTSGNTALGGDDFDAVIIDALSLAEPKTRVLWLNAARVAREELSQAETVNIVADGQTIPLTRTQVETLLAPLIEHTLLACENALRDADLKKQDIKATILVGGATRMPLVRTKVEVFFGKRPLTNVNPDEVVAVGAALQAEALTFGANHLLLDVTPLSLGLETMGGLVEKIVHRNTPVPVSVSQEFTTYQDSQDGIIIHVLQGERELVDQNRSLARFELTGIPQLPAGIARVKVTFIIDSDGLLTVEAREETTGTAQTVDVKPAYGLKLEEIERMLRESMEHAREDIFARLLVEAQVDAERVAIETESAISQNPEVLRMGEREVIESQIRRLRFAAKGNDREEMEYEVNELAKLTRDFAERRMNNAIAQAIGGKHIDEMSGD